MKKITIVLPLLILLSGLVQGQNAGEFSARYFSGWGSYAMEDLKALYYDAHAELPFTPRITEEFPAYYYYQVQLLYCPVQDFKVGLSYGSASTGARSTYSDYSGTYYFDQRIASDEWGALVQLRLGKWRSFSFQPGLSVSAVFTDLELDERLEVYDHRDIFSLSSSAVGAGIKPFINFSWQFRFIEVMAEAGYLIYTGKGLQEKNGDKLLNKRGEEINPNWSGYRLGLGLGININGSPKP